MTMLLSYGNCIAEAKMIETVRWAKHSKLTFAVLEAYNCEKKDHSFKYHIFESFGGEGIFKAVTESGRKEFK